MSALLSSLCFSRLSTCVSHDLSNFVRLQATFFTYDVFGRACSNTPPPVVNECVSFTTRERVGLFLLQKQTSSARRISNNGSLDHRAKLKTHMTICNQMIKRL
mmetsp:Transcript_16999/g.24095  ORF Transcript_16999/g.24095 Transcript_16999/m.24095 type:complete len:103 (-) Transcript_16999:965-1273(-)